MRRKITGEQVIDFILKAIFSFMTLGAILTFGFPFIILPTAFFTTLISAPFAPGSALRGWVETICYWLGGLLTAAYLLSFIYSLFWADPQIQKTTLYPKKSTFKCPLLYRDKRLRLRRFTKRPG